MIDDYDGGWMDRMGTDWIGSIAWVLMMGNL
jgi:hypothetical protein